MNRKRPLFSWLIEAILNKDYNHDHAVISLRILEHAPIDKENVPQKKTKLIHEKAFCITRIG